ncbi:hypothetical protein V5F72_03485 [Xanthobacter flavus]|uniref:hypothetical protein n=1 Tax=Xanthobacter flavus TaxID=281 RepID=UPI00372A02D8
MSQAAAEWDALDRLRRLTRRSNPEYHDDGVLYAPHREGGYGFPVTPNLRDLLVGRDNDLF